MYPWTAFRFRHNSVIISYTMMIRGNKSRYSWDGAVWLAPPDIPIHGMSEAVNALDRWIEWYVRIDKRHEQERSEMDDLYRRLLSEGAVWQAGVKRYHDHRHPSGIWIWQSFPDMPTAQARVIEYIDLRRNPSTWRGDNSIKLQEELARIEASTTSIILR